MVCALYQLQIYYLWHPKLVDEKNELYKMCLLIHIVVGPPPFSSENTALVLDAGAKHNTTKQHLVTALACYQTLLSDNSDGAVDDGTGLLSNLTLRQQ